MNITSPSHFTLVGNIGIQFESQENSILDRMGPRNAKFLQFMKQVFQPLSVLATNVASIRSMTDAPFGFKSHQCVQSHTWSKLTKRWVVKWGII